jgi:16S rRNA (cytosine1402-N4)-methyltransferase
MEFFHKSVLFDECMEALSIRPDGIYVDCTTGGGGHSEGIASQLSPEGKLLCLDRDAEAIQAAKKRLNRYSNIIFINQKFSLLSEILQEQGIQKVDGILMDLGVSSYQLDNPQRGFSFHEDAPLDMRMSQTGISAYDVVNEYPPETLEKILFLYGEEKYAKGIVREIINARESAKIETTLQLAALIKQGVPAKVRREKNPCRKTFQAIRIEVNGELDELKTGMESAFDALNIGGRLAIITFHSLEDRMVKNAFKAFSTGCTCPSDFPVCVCDKEPRGQLAYKKPITASEKELNENNRSRSAKLRTIEKIRL